MGRWLLLGVVGFFLSGAAGAVSPPVTKLSDPEKIEVQRRIERFYGSENGFSSLDVPPPKYDARTGQPVDVNEALRRAKPAADPLITASGKKASPSYHKARCRHLKDHRFPHIDCEKTHWEKVQPNDNVEDLVKTWVPEGAAQLHLDDVTTSGEIRRAVWSGDYWRTKWGLTSYRYAKGKTFGTYREAVDSYQQPLEWQKARDTLTAEELEKEITSWSPAEKYDLLVGDEVMTLTDHQKAEGSYSLGEDGDVEGWFGICHGWAPAAYMVPPPVKSFTTSAVKGKRVAWTAHDVRALATLAWANGRYVANFIGGRCDQKDPKRYDNGRLAQPECFDNNPATFHLSLANLIGKEGVPMVMDATFDYQVWNQPVVAYELSYFNPLRPEKTGTDWKRLAVKYDDKFKKKDRFQTPLTRGKRGDDGKYDDSQVAQVVGVAATVVYLAEIAASAAPDVAPNRLVRVTYTYDLELREEEGKTIIAGGEWHENTHPDFLWTPQRDSVALFYHDREKVGVDLEKEPSAGLAETAAAASAYSYPLCRVLEKLIEKASGVSTYKCPLL